MLALLDDADAAATTQELALGQADLLLGIACNGLTSVAMCEYFLLHAPVDVGTRVLRGRILPLMRVTDGQTLLAQLEHLGPSLPTHHIALHVIDSIFLFLQLLVKNNTLLDR